MTVFKALSGAPAASKFPNAARWYKNVASYEAEFATLVGTASTDAAQYGPEAGAAPAAVAAPTEEEEDDDVDLFGSSDEEEDAEKEALAAKRLEEYRAKKALKPKTSMFVCKATV